MVLMVEKHPDHWQSTLARETIVCLPPELLFYEKVTVPAAVDANEIADFVELTLEEKSPFPLRDLCFGYLYEATERNLLIYAAIRRRVEQLYPDALAKARFVLPAFCLLHGFSSHAKRLIALQTDEAQTLASINDFGLPLPLDDAEHLTDENTLRLNLEELEWGKDESLTVSLRLLDSASEDSPATLSTTRLSSPTLWAADMRSADFKQLERSRRNREKQLLRAITIGTWVALFLLISQVGLWGFNRHVDRLISERERLQPAVLTVQDRHSLLTTLEQVAAAELRPLDVLEAMNRLRPDAIHFTEMRAEPQNRITVEGIAGSVNALNRYAESLRESGKFRVSDPRTLVRAGRTTFTLTVDYTGPLPVLSGTASIPANGNQSQP
jgi:hypothetical protein